MFVRLIKTNMFQDILALSIVFVAILYILINIYRIVRPIKTASQTVCGGCSAAGCDTKSKFSTNSH
jgi:hypothetical protein